MNTARTRALALILAFSAAVCASGQTPTQTPVTVPAVAAISLPTYIAGGGAYNQLSGWNLWVSAIVPVANQSGVYESTTTDLFPTASTVGGKTVYTFQTSIRQGVHKVVHNDGKNTVLIGGDAGVSFSQSSTASTSSTVGVAGSFTATYVRQFSPHWAVMAPVRALYLPNLGWNPVVEVGFVWKP